MRKLTMEFIKAQDLKTVANILKALQFDVMTSAMAGCVCEHRNNTN